LKKWTTPDFRNTHSTANLEEEEIVTVLGKDGNASMPEQVNRPNPWMKMMMMMMMMMMMTVSYVIYKQSLMVTVCPSFQFSFYSRTPSHVV
jgi:hypothetical protein